MSAPLAAVAWEDVVTALVGPGWVRLPGAIDRRTCIRLADAAPSPWAPVRPEGGVRQAGLSCGVFFAAAPLVVRELGLAICESLAEAAIPRGVPGPPWFNEVQWGRTRPDGADFISAHRDPPGAGGVIAIVTLWGDALFRIWSADVDPRRSPAGGEAAAVPAEWRTNPGDLVLLRGNGWPREDARCPMHEVGSPASGERMKVTFRHNTRGPGADYFT